MGLLDFLKRQDRFGVPVQLTYKGERFFTTAVGGCCSIMFVLTAIALFTVNAISFYRNPQFSQSESVSYISYNDGHEPYYLPTNRTTLAVYVGNAKYLRARFY